jgi:hypothetical protein
MADKQTPNTDHYPKLSPEDRQYKNQDEFDDTMNKANTDLNRSEVTTQRTASDVTVPPGNENPHNDEEVRKPSE